MDLREYANLVAAMREQQNKFFRSPSGSADRLNALNAAKPLEGRVDKVTAEIRAPEKTGSLFGPES